MTPGEDALKRGFSGVRRGPHRPDVHNFNRVATAVAAAFQTYSTVERIMKDSNQRLLDKVNTLRQQINNDEMALFQHELVVKDYDTLPTEGTPKEVKDRLLGAKKGVEVEIALCKQRIATRAPMLAELEAQLEAGK